VTSGVITFKSRSNGFFTQYAVVRRAGANFMIEPNSYRHHSKLHETVSTPARYCAYSTSVCGSGDVNANVYQHSSEDANRYLPCRTCQSVDESTRGNVYCRFHAASESLEERRKHLKRVTPSVLFQIYTKQNE